MVKFTTRILKFGQNGEKTGWTYIEVPSDIAAELNPNVRKSYRVNAILDQHKFAGIALLPMGDASFILPINATIRKAIAKKEGAQLAVQLELAKEKYQLNNSLVNCLKEVPEASAAFYKMPPSHQNYYSKWIESAKTEPTREKRIIMTVTALAKGMSYAEMIRSSKIF
jgi:DNA-directed RNA polymerase subunit L